MGRLKKNEQDKKIKITISVNRELYSEIKKQKLIPSRLLNELLEKHYGNKNL